MEYPITIRKKPVVVKALQWFNNEPFVREFVQDDRLLKFPDGKCEVWNSEEMCWMNVPHSHYIVKGVKGELYPVSLDVLNMTYEIVDE